MPRKFLSVLLAAFLIVGFASFMTKADVTGSFKATVVIQPIPCGIWLNHFNATVNGVPVTALTCEDTLQKSDFEGRLLINWTISGLTLGLDLSAGFAGLEHILTTLQATLGALSITDQFFFAVPFGTDIVQITNSNNTQTDVERMYTVINPNLFFVKKRVTATISIAGITLTNLALLEDVSFPKSVLFTYPGDLFAGFLAILPATGTTGYFCADVFGTSSYANGGRNRCLPAQANFVGYNPASQYFRFGDTLTIEGQTVSGITIRNITGINMDPQPVEQFKKIGFPGVVCTNPKLQFGVEKIQVEGIPIGPVTWNEFLEFRMAGSDQGPNAIGNPPFNNSCVTSNPNFSLGPFFAQSEFSFNTPLGAVTADFHTTNITQQIIDVALIELSAGGVTIDQELDQNLALASTVITLATTLNPDSNPASLTLITVICQLAADPLQNCNGAGFNLILGQLSVKRSGVTFSTQAVFLTSVPGSVSLWRLRFSLAAAAGPVNLGLQTQLVGTPLVFDKLQLTASVNF